MKTREDENDNNLKITYTIKPSFTTRKLKQLQQENKILKENAENNDKVVDKINWENQLLKKENKKQKEVINKAIEYIKNYESIKVYNIKAYYEYIDEDGYEEYNYNEDFKKELIRILQGE